MSDESVRVPLRVDSSWAWAMTAVPLLGLAVGFIWPTVGAGWIALGGVVVNGLLARQDEKRMHAAGYKGVGSLWAVILVPVYLILRARQVGSPAIPLVWAAAFVAALVGWVTVAPVQMDTGYVERQVARQIRTQFQVDANVSCPDSVALRVNESFTCGITAGGDSARVLITLTGHDGTFSWQLLR